MQMAHACLLGFITWTFLLVLAIVAIRTILVLLRRARATEFPASKPHGSELYQRLLRAHGNCVENLPLFGGLVMLADAQGVILPAAFCQIYLIARIAQSCLHIASARSHAVAARLVCFVVQLMCLAVMGARLAPHVL